MIDIVWEIPLEMPGYRLDKQALQEMGKAVEATALRNIKEQKQLDGSPLKRNAPGYAKWKRAQGWGVRSLVAGDHSLVKGQGKSFATTGLSVSGSSVTVEPAPGLAQERSEAVQERGYTGWFGIAPRTVEEIKEVLKRFILRAHKKAAKKAGR